MDRATQQNAAMVEETTAASHSLASETDELTKLVAEFRLTKAVDHHVGRRLPSRIASKELKAPNRAGQFRAARLRKAAG
jgi:methyl-accepting chemotaxis protein